MRRLPLLTLRMAVAVLGHASTDCAGLAMMALFCIVSVRLRAWPDLP